MTVIDVPDWVVEDACKNAWPQFRSGMETEIWEFADADRRDRLREITIAALRAALSAWVVPVGCMSEHDVERFQSGEEIEFMWPLSSQKSGDATLYTLRQEKPE